MKALQFMTYGGPEVLVWHTLRTRTHAPGRWSSQVQAFPFERAAEAYRLSQDGHVCGKLVLVP